MEVNEPELTLVTRNGCFGLPTACPSCLSVYIYLRFSQVQFRLSYNLIAPDSDHIPYLEDGVYVTYNNERGGIIECLREDGIVDLDTDVYSVPEWISTKAMVDSWLADALLYELWIGSGGSSAYDIYYSGLPWPIGKVLFLKQVSVVKKLLGINRDNAERRVAEIYRRAAIAYEALSTRLGDEAFLFGDRPTSLDAVFLGHALITLQALPESSMLHMKFLEHGNLVGYSEKLKTKFIEAAPSSSSASCNFRSHPSSSTPGKGFSSWGSDKKTKPKEKTEEEKTLERRAKYFLAAQFVAVIVFLSVLGGAEIAGADDNSNEPSDYYE